MFGTVFCSGHERVSSALLLTTPEQLGFGLSPSAVAVNPVLEEFSSFFSTAKKEG